MLLTSRNQYVMPTLFNELLNWSNWNSNSCVDYKSMPKMNVSETDKGYELELSVPGLSKDDLNLSVDSENNLVIEMVQKEEKNEEDKKQRHYLRHEFNSLQFKQVLALPENVKKDKISATVQHGILHIVLPKFTAEEKKKLAQTIEIK